MACNKPRALIRLKNGLLHMTETKIRNTKTVPQIQLDNSLSIRIGARSNPDVMNA